jgi:enoyl-CoA hydratase/3-hydroxyacyl-CoA dehydrogenase
MGGGSELALACRAIVATPAGSMAFPETGIGIYPGLGGMLRLARQVGPELAKYYVFTGASLSAADMLALGIAARLCAAGEIPATLRALLQEELPDKYRPRDIPQPFAPYRQLGRPDNIDKLLNGKMPQGVSADIAARTLKSVGFKAPLALKISNEIIDAQAGRPIAAAVEIELGRLAEIFSSADALEGLTSLGRKRPEFKGK